MNRRTLQNLRSDILGKVPASSDILPGEIAVNYSADGEKLYIVNSKGEVIPFISEKEINKKLETAENFLGFLEGKNEVTSLTDIPSSKRLVVASISANSSYSLSGVQAAGREIHTIVKNTGTVSITIALPTALPYILLCEQSIIIAPGEYAEINALSDGNNLYIRTT